MTKHDIRKKQRSQTIKKLIAFSLNDEIIVIFALFCISPVFSNMLFPQQGNSYLKRHTERLIKSVNLQK